MSFFDSMCVIRRAPESANILGRCIVVGTQALVVPNLLEVNGAILQKAQLISQSDFEACRLREERGFFERLGFREDMDRRANQVFGLDAGADASRGGGVEFVLQAASRQLEGRFF